ncbi:Alpha/Beta hydrolase protein [Massariosphaeria phaeospora]|uniref:Alpha/Beta hydrolase protein n=1 Tax=Massariosphaeria phaeospora TaxID=100035 RepID=A0A7C8IEJ1_9PLEO|nr:Alpha/Beta hydrolase protein [Massariosphaeria phaeospora]
MEDTVINSQRPYPQPVQPYVGNSTVNLATVPPQTGYLKSSWSKADRLAGKTYTDLRDQLASGAGKSMTMLTTNCIDKPTNLVSKKSTQMLNQGAALCDLISSRLDVIITSIDDERFSGEEQDLLYDNQAQDSRSTSTLQPPTARGHAANPVYSNAAPEKGSNTFSKVWLYSNSRLPPHLPPFKVYLPTYPLLCLAATYSERAYSGPKSRKAMEEALVPSDWRSGTKAMVLKAVPVDDMNTVVFAIRGSQTFMDWAVNYRSEPTSPAGFLDDEGNLCHSGFLYVARKMIQPVADRLRNLLQENPSRSNCSLLITGHSAGGAVAALLFAHMMSSIVESELSYLTSFFKRVHCITFGAPPVSLLPLQKPTDKRHRKSLFYSFINEGDPVPRADKQVVRSLLKLYAAPAPNNSCISTLASFSNLNLSSTNTSQSSKPSSSKLSKFSTKPSKTSLNTTSSAAPSWPIPSCTLSPAGRLVVLRVKGDGGGEDDVEAVTVDDEVLRRVVYGDPLKHMMALYKSRVEGIAVRAVTAGGY